VQRAGKNVVDMVQIWQREHLRWDVLKMRDFTVTYGCCAFVAGQLLTPFLLRVTSARAFTSFANLTNLTGFLMRGWAENPVIFWLAIVPMLPGVNGSSASAMKAIASDHALAGASIPRHALLSQPPRPPVSQPLVHAPQRIPAFPPRCCLETACDSECVGACVAGFGAGEYSGYFNNLRALVGEYCFNNLRALVGEYSPTSSTGSAASLMYGTAYSVCISRGWHPVAHPRRYHIRFSPLPARDDPVHVALLANKPADPAGYPILGGRAHGGRPARADTPVDHYPGHKRALQARLSAWCPLPTEHNIIAVNRNHRRTHHHHHCPTTCGPFHSLSISNF
jgi:hypothetical protein